MFSWASSSTFSTTEAQWEVAPVLAAIFTVWGLAWEYAISSSMVS